MINSFVFRTFSNLFTPHFVVQSQSIVFIKRLWKYFSSSLWNDCPFETKASKDMMIKSSVVQWNIYLSIPIDNFRKMSEQRKMKKIWRDNWWYNNQSHCNLPTILLRPKSGALSIFNDTIASELDPNWKIVEVRMRKMVGVVCMSSDEFGWSNCILHF